MATNPIQARGAATAGVPAGVEAPYVGLRPFDRSERAIFWGREQDAQFLSDKIFSARLTLLYAKSGVGKSSILRTLVIPLIEDQHAHVVYFDACGGADPYELLRATLIELAFQMGIPDAGIGAPTLLELARLIQSVDDKTLVLILDQFEEFLIVHGQKLDPLKKDMAALVRASDVDMRIVLSLRQEFLAALEPFRYEILNLFQSTYLLDSLDDRSIREAIEKPAFLFGKAYEPALLDQLIRDLRAQEATGNVLPTNAPIDLPMMQLVCSQLWEAALARGTSTLGLDLYKEMGGAEKILDTYVRGVMPNRWSEQRLTARLMKHLAPTSGFKRSYSVGDLARNEDLDSNRVKEELQRLSRRRILQSREFRGQELWELQHDAFIRMIAPWRDNVLRRAKMQRRIISIFVVAAVAIGLLVPFIKERLEIYSNTEARLGELKGMSAADRAKRFDTVTAYLLEKDRIDLLSTLLKKYAEDLPKDYGLSNPESQDMKDSPEETAHGPVSIHYSSTRPLDSRYLDQTWRFWVRTFAEKQGLPLPFPLRLKEESTYPKSLVRFTEESNELLKFRTPPYDQEKEIFITSENLKVPDGKRLQNFLDDRCGPECRKISWPEDPNVELWAVPRWSGPLWKVTGRPATDGSGLPALLLALKLQRDPTPFFTDATFKLLEERVKEEYPHTLREALAARGRRLKGDLIELVKIGQPLNDIVAVLDVLAACPQLDSKHAAEQAQKDLLQTSVRLDGFENINSARGELNESSSDEMGNGYKQAAAYLSPAGRSLLVHLGRDLESNWTNKENEEDGLSPELVQSIGEMRDNVFRQFGLSFPPISFSRNAEDLSVPPLALHIEVINASGVSSNDELVRLQSPSDTTGFADALRSRAITARAKWILSEDVYQQRQRVQPEFRKWLEQRYSLTQQKLLMKAVISPTTAEKDKPEDIPTENTLRHPDWLLTSLVFWAQADNDHNAAKMVEDLRATQRARLAPVRSPAVVPLVAQAISEGIRALEKGRTPEAEGAFSNAVRADREAAIQLFLASYPESLRAIELQEFEGLCNRRNQNRRYMWPKDLESFLVQSHNDVVPEQEMTLGLCLVRMFGNRSHKKDAAIGTELLQRHAKPDDWPAHIAGEFAIKILKDFDSVSDSSSLREGSELLLKSAIRRLDIDDSRALFESFATIPQQQGPKQWAWKLLKELVKARPDIYIQFELGRLLALRESEEDLRESLELFQQVEQTLKHKPTSPQSREMLDSCRHQQAAVLLQLSGLGMMDGRNTAEAILQQLRNSKFVPVSNSMAQLRLFQGRYGEAIAIADAALSQSPRDSGPYLTKFLAQLWERNREGAAATADATLRKADELQQEILDQQLCRHCLDNRIRLAGTKDEALKAARQLAGIAARTSPEYQEQFQSYLKAVIAREAKSADAAWRRMDDLEQQTRNTLTAMLFVASLGEMILHGGATSADNGTGAEETARRFLETDHEYVPYIAIMLYARTSGAAQQEAREVIQERWRKFDRSHWQQRLRGGDETVWREMLIGYYLKEVTRDQIFNQLEDERSYAKSDLHAIPIPRQALLCEAYFYDALLATVEHDQARRDSDLQKVLDTKVYGYIEYDLAMFLRADEKSQH